MIRSVSKVDIHTNFSLMIRLQPISTSTDTLCPYTTLFRSQVNGRALDPGGTSYAFGPWVLREVERLLVDEAGREVALSSGEYHLLTALVRHPRQVMSRDRLLDMVRGREADIFDRAIDNLVSRSEEHTSELQSLMRISYAV